MKTRQFVVRIAADAGVWYTIPALFLSVYIRTHSAALPGAALHIVVMAIPLGALTIARLCISRLMPTPTAARLGSSILSSALLSLMFVYYGVVLIGLSHWGGVPTWDAIPSFLAQAPEIDDALGVSSSMLYAATVLAYVLVTTMCWFYLKRWDWTEPATRQLSSPALSVVVIAGMAILMVAAYNISDSSWASASEPISMTLFPTSVSVVNLEGHRLDRLAAQNLDVQEDMARSAYRPVRSGARSNLILIVVDALRPDHMGVYGYGRDTTPNLSHLAAAGKIQLVRNMHSPCGDTICGLLSLATSKYPRMFSLRPFTLMEALRRNGYHVNLILSGDHSHFYNLAKFYGTVDSYFDGTLAHGYSLNDDRLVVERLREMPVSNGQPVMFQFHLMSAHVLRSDDSKHGPYQPAMRYTLLESRDIGARSTPNARATNFYDDGVLNADHIIAELIELLRMKGYLEDALVVITADHGESLGEHGLFSHANSVREELLRIPFLMIPFGREPVPVRSLASFPSQLDIAPTIMEALGLPRPSTWSGRPLQDGSDSEYAFFEERREVGLFDYGTSGKIWKYWRDSNTGIEHVFNLTTDPRELHDEVGSVPANVIGEWRWHALVGKPLYVGEPMSTRRALTAGRVDNSLRGGR
jgi:glucan phosphoethanolaminetransferase (alkaline phosphatase superfamily)